MKLLSTVGISFLMVFSACSSDKKEFRAHIVSQAVPGGSVIVLTVVERSDTGELTGLILEKGGAEYHSKVKVSSGQKGNLLGIQINGLDYDYSAYRLVEISLDGTIAKPAVIPAGVLNFSALIKEHPVTDALEKAKIK